MKNKRKNTVQTGILRRSWPGMAWGVVFFVLVCLLPGTLWAATTYYVDASNSSAGDGSSGNPWRNISSITGIVDGDTILFKRGKTWHESLTIPANSVTIGAYDDPADPAAPLPIFDGTTTSTAWALLSGATNIYTLDRSAGDPGMLIYNGAPKPSIATLQFNSIVSSNGSEVQPGAVLIQSGGTVGYCSLWVTSVDSVNKEISGITFFRKQKHWDPTNYFKYPNAAYNVQLRQLVNGREKKSYLILKTKGLQFPVNPSDGLKKNGDWYWNSGKLYLYSETDPNSIVPTSIVQISNLPVGIDANNKNNLIIEDITVQGFQDMGIRLHGTSGSIVRRMEVRNIGAIEEDLGAGIKGYKTGIMIDYANNNIVTDNLVDGVLRVGIGLFAGYTADLTEINTVSNNIIKYSGSSGISLNTDDSTTAATVTGNMITGNTILYSNRLAYDSAGVYAIFVGTGNSITNNTILLGGSKYLRSAGIMVDWGEDGNPPIVAPVTITGNIIENNSLGGIAVTGTGHTITGNRLAYNGLASWDSAQVVFFPVIENVSGSTVRNNVVEAETGKYLFLETIVSSWSNPTNDIDNNTYRSRAASTFCRNDWSGSGVCGWVNFSTWQSTTGHDTNSSTFSFITDPPPPDVKSINSTYLLLLK